MPYIDATASQYANPLDASDVLGWEQYQGCRVPPESQLMGERKGPSPSPLERQVGGDHYKDLKIQPAEFLRQLNVPHLEGEAIYRILRHKQKGGKEDIDKAIHTLQIIRELDYGAK